eukprot:scpid52497/ scgid2857/ Squalene monooxygenase; Squalene epoxidase
MESERDGSWLLQYCWQPDVLASCVLVTCLGALSFGWKTIRWHRVRVLRSNPSRPTGGAEEDADVIVVGAGILGNAMATSLARDGRKVLLIERDWSQPDRIVGELLQPGGFRALKRLGLQESLDGSDCHRTHGYVVHNRESSQKVDLLYPSDDHTGETIEGRAFHHGRFVTGLRRLSKAEQLVTPVHGSALSLIREGDHVVGVACRLKDDSEVKEFRAPLTVVADGCFSNLRKTLVSARPQNKSNFAGLVMHNCPQTRDHFAEVILASPAPVLVYQISSDSTRVLVDIPGQKMPADAKTYLLETVAPQLPELLHGPFVEAVSTQAVRSMPNSFLPAAPVLQPGALVLGDAFNMRHPLTGAGMTVALHDVEFWRDELKQLADLHDVEAVLAIQRRFHWQRKMSHSFVANTLAQALYALFAAGDDDSMRSLRRACFQYFLLGGDCAAGPISLLAILHPDPWTLIRHYIAVCLYGVYLDAMDCPMWKRPALAPWIACKLIWASCRVMLPLAFSELHFAK